MSMMITIMMTMTINLGRLLVLFFVFRNKENSIQGLHASIIHYQAIIPSITIMLSDIIISTSRISDEHLHHHHNNHYPGWHKLRERRSPKGQGLLRKEGPPTYASLSRNLVVVLSRFRRFLKGFHRAFNKSHLALKEFLMKAILLS